MKNLVIIALLVSIVFLLYTRQVSCMGPERSSAASNCVMVPAKCPDGWTASGKYCKKWGDIGVAPKIEPRTYVTKCP